MRRNFHSALSGDKAALSSYNLYVIFSADDDNHESISFPRTFHPSPFTNFIIDSERKGDRDNWCL